VIEGLFIHPIKGCAPIAVQLARVTLRGLEDDRRWMVVDEAGRFLSQRELPAMGAIAVQVSGSDLVVDGELELPRNLGDGPRREVAVWSHTGEALVHEAGSTWFSRRLGRPCSLVFMPDDVVRPVNPARGRPGDLVSFADGYPVLLATEASRAEVERRAGVPIAMARFRPNVVTSAPAPFDEDRWRALSLGAVSFRNVKPCERCVVTTLDPSTQAPGKEPLRTLATFRARDGAVWFGVNLIPDAEGELRVGDPVQVTEFQPPFVEAGSGDA